MLWVNGCFWSPGKTKGVGKEQGIRSFGTKKGEKEMVELMVDRKNREMNAIMGDQALVSIRNLGPSKINQKSRVPLCGRKGGA